MHTGKGRKQNISDNSRVLGLPKIPAQFKFHILAQIYNGR